MRPSVVLSSPCYMATNADQAFHQESEEIIERDLRRTAYSGREGLESKKCLEGFPEGRVLCCQAVRVEGHQNDCPTSPPNLGQSGLLL